MRFNHRDKRLVVSDPPVLVWPDGVVDVAVMMGLHVEGVAVSDGAAVEVLVFEGSEEPLDHPVRLGRSHACARVS